MAECERGAEGEAEAQGEGESEREGEPLPRALRLPLAQRVAEGGPLLLTDALPEPVARADARADAEPQPLADALAEALGTSREPEGKLFHSATKCGCALFPPTSTMSRASANGCKPMMNSSFDRS